MAHQLYNHNSSKKSLERLSIDRLSVLLSFSPNVHPEERTHPSAVQPGNFKSDIIFASGPDGYAATSDLSGKGLRTLGGLYE